MTEGQPFDNKQFDFENDLILGPVYKRVLFVQLCKLPAISEAKSKDLEPQSTSNQGRKRYVNCGKQKHGWQVRIQRENRFGGNPADSVRQSSAKGERRRRYHI